MFFPIKKNYSNHKFENIIAILQNDSIVCVLTKMHAWQTDKGEIEVKGNAWEFWLNKIQFNL